MRRTPLAQTSAHTRILARNPSNPAQGFEVDLKVESQAKTQVGFEAPRYQQDNMADLRNAEYTLYSSPFSLYSMMARHTVQLGPLTDHTIPPRNIDLSFINHGKNHNLKEEYLRINPKGQVPSLMGNVLKEPLTDSISISLYLAEKHYPALLPTAHAGIIKQLLERIHQVNGLSINNKKATPGMQKYNPSPAADILKRTDISSEYRKALEFKLGLYVPVQFPRRACPYASRLSPAIYAS